MWYEHLKSRIRFFKQKTLHWLWVSSSVLGFSILEMGVMLANSAQEHEKSAMCHGRRGALFLVTECHFAPSLPSPPSKTPIAHIELLVYSDTCDYSSSHLF